MVNSSISVEGRTIITFDGDKSCNECGKGGAAENGYCMKCLADMLTLGRKMRTIPGRRHQRALLQRLRGAR